MKRLILVAFVALVGCSSGAFCETPNTAACPTDNPSGESAWCVAPGADACFSRGNPDCEFEDLVMASCMSGMNEDGPTCPEGWTLHCYD